ncbi:hypothetical protein ACIGFL_15455 [Pseudomonas sp. NPDC077649]|uniref:hypothetical protein n=1 Tax=Pseudomonas sp. NPDC077649 TaxID=3364423 RepID=UPI0037C9D950
MDVLEYKSLQDLAENKWDIALHGKHSDDRDKEIRSFLEAACAEMYNFSYIPHDMLSFLNGAPVELHYLSDELKIFAGRKIVIDATSFDVAELAILCTALNDSDLKNFDVIYAEPHEYSHDSNNGEKSFNLSESLLGFEEAGIPGISRAIPSDEPKLFIFFMGYEGDRFRNALELSELSGKECSLVFGVPAFKFGWDKNSLLSSARAILENNLQDAFLFCGATNISGVNRLLQELRQKHQNELFFLVPLGPKPMSVGAIKFLCSDKNTALLYDHPARSSNRSTGIASIHLARGFLS